MVLSQLTNGIKIMLSFNNLGNLGRLANQMFQYASLKGIARKNEYEFCIPSKDLFGISDLNVRSSDCTIHDCFDLSNIHQEIIKQPLLQEKGFGFDEQLLSNCPDNVDLFGYYQSEKYFKHIEDEIRKDFTFKKEVLDLSLDFFKNFENTKVISLHIRRGDYVVNSNHPVQTIEYYEKALEYFDDTLPVLVFSDDSEWCKQQELFIPDRFMISEENSTDADLCLMSLCKYHIIANSSYSWWGSWLAKSQRTIAPKKWFDGDCINHSTQDLYCSDWIII
jgi:hypothetical protein